MTPAASRALYGDERPFWVPFGAGGTLPPGRDRTSAPPLDAERRRQAQYLRRLGRVLAATAGEGLTVELHWQERRPFLPYLRVKDVPVWVVPTSSGWRFLWLRYRSYPATDAAGAARELLADLGY